VRRPGERHGLVNLSFTHNFQVKRW
jgi:hypothetical protein